MEGEFEQHIERIRVPDEDAYDWAETLQEGGFSQEEIEAILIHLNDTFAAKRLKVYLDSEIAELEKIVGKDKQLTVEQRAAIKDVALERLRAMSQSQLENRFRKQEKTP